MSASKDKEESSPRLAETMLYTSEELSSGSPSIYHLRMREEMRRGEAMIARLNPSVNLTVSGAEKLRKCSWW